MENMPVEPELQCFLIESFKKTIAEAFRVIDCRLSNGIGYVAISGSIYLTIVRICLVRIEMEKPWIGAFASDVDGPFHIDPLAAWYCGKHEERGWMQIPGELCYLLDRRSARMISAELKKEASKLQKAINSIMEEV
jgi:hypothetical protein